MKITYITPLEVTWHELEATSGHSRYVEATITYAVEPGISALCAVTRGTGLVTMNDRHYTPSDALAALK